MNRMLKLLLIAGAIALAPLASGQNGQNYPTKPIKFVVGFAPGGNNDNLARLIGQKLSERVGQPVVIENKPGADGIVAIEYVSRTPPDGYTLLIGSSGQFVFNPGLYEKLSYDPINDFVPITQFASDALVICVNPSFPAKNLKELIALAKAKPGGYFYSSSSPPMRVSMELFKRLAGVDIVHVPYKGGAGSVMAAVSGEVTMTMTSISPALAQIRTGKLRPIAVTSIKRSPVLPDVPTISETGMPFEGFMWAGLLAPAGTPKPIIDKLYGELAVILKSDAVQKNFHGQGLEVGGMPPAEFGHLIKTSMEKWTKVSRDFNIRADK